MRSLQLSSAKVALFYIASTPFASITLFLATPTAKSSLSHPLSVCIQSWDHECTNQSTQRPCSERGNTKCSPILSSSSNNTMSLLAVKTGLLFICSILGEIFCKIPGRRCLLCLDSRGPKKHQSSSTCGSTNRPKLYVSNPKKFQ